MSRNENGVRDIAKKLTEVQSINRQRDILALHQSVMIAIENCKVIMLSSKRCKYIITESFRSMFTALHVCQARIASCNPGQISPRDCDKLKNEVSTVLEGYNKHINIFKRQNEKSDSKKSLWNFAKKEDYMRL